MFYKFLDSEISSYILNNHDELQKLKKILHQSNPKFIIFAGAGMSQESGLPMFNSAVTFNGDNLKNVNGDILLLKDCDNRIALQKLFFKCKPHKGYYDLLNICKNYEHYVCTTNIDGYFHKAGFNSKYIIELHGNIHDNNNNNYVNSNYTLSSDLCGKALISNVFTGGFDNYIYQTKSIEHEISKIVATLKSNNNYSLIIIEIGAGVDIPLIRDYSEFLVENKECFLIRINPEYPKVPDKLYKLKSDKICSLQMKASEAMTLIKRELVDVKIDI